MEKSIETIWQEGFLEKDALVAPKLNDLYNQKSTHLVDKFRRRYKININAIFIFAVFLLPFTYITNMFYMGIPMVFLFGYVVFYSLQFKKKLDKIEVGLDSYQYLNAFNNWLKEMVSFNTRTSRFLYPIVFLSILLGFWFGGFGGDIPGEKCISGLLAEYPDMQMLFGLPLIGILLVFSILGILAFFGGKIGMWDINLVYGRIFKKLNGLLAEMEELRG